MKPLVALSGLFYPVAILRYFESALLRRTDIDFVTVGPDFGTWLPWKSGMHLGYTVRTVDIPLPRVTSDQPPVQFAEAKIRSRLGRLPDLWLQVDAGYHFSGKPVSGCSVIVATDPHVLNYDRQRTLADYFYCMQTPYAKSDDRYFPYAYDVFWHRRIGDDERPTEPTYDASLCGLVYSNRLSWASLLRGRGYKVFLDTGPSYGDARKIYAESVTGFNWSSKKDTVARCFELMAMGVPSPMNRTSDLLRLFRDGEHFLGFDSVGEAAQASISLIESEALRNEIRSKALEAVEPHTYDARVETILRDVQII